MQILIAAQGVTPNSVEINTNCIPPATAPPAGPTFACKAHYFGPLSPRDFYEESFSPLLLQQRLQRPFAAGLPDRRNNISPKYGDTKSYTFMQRITGADIAEGDYS